MTDAGDSASGASRLPAADTELLDEPSDGLEPSTPPYHVGPIRHYTSQRATERPQTVSYGS
jgi:hypothetical protein